MIPDNRPAPRSTDIDEAVPPVSPDQLFAFGLLMNDVTESLDTARLLLSPTDILVANETAADMYPLAIRSTMSAVAHLLAKTLTAYEEGLTSLGGADQ